MKRNFYVLILLLFILTKGYSYTIYWSGGVYYNLTPPFPTRSAPGTGDIANAFQVADVNCILSSDATVKSLSVTTGDLTLTGSMTLTIAENAIINSGATITIQNGSTLIIESSISNSGTVIVNLGGNLIQSGTGSATGSGYQIQVSGYASDERLNFWSSPITSAGLTNVFSGSNECDFYYLNASAQIWTRDIGSSTCTPTAPTSGDGKMDVGRGYSIGGGGSPTFSGTINNGTITESISASGTTNPDWTGANWNLIGNPYPSSINATSFVEANSSITTGTLYFWADDNTVGTGYDGATDYASWNTGGGTAASGGGSGTVPNGSISVGQGFIIQATSSSSVTFTNSMRGGSNTQFFKTESESIPRLWISANQDKHASSQILIAFSENATDGIDWSYDSPKLSISNKFLFGSLLGTEPTPYGIQSFSKMDLETKREIPLSIITNKSGVSTFQIDAVENWDSTLLISVKDHVTGKIQNLKNGSFSTYLNANQKYDSRFTLIIKNPAGSSVGIKEVPFSNLRLYYSNQSLNISSDQNISRIEIFSISGVAMIQKQINPSTHYSLGTNHLTQGIYIARITQVTGETISKRFTVQ